MRTSRRRETGRLTGCTRLTVFPLFNVRGVHSVPLTVQHARFAALTLENDSLYLPCPAGGGVFFRGVLRMYDICTTARRIYGGPAGARVTIGVCEAREIRAVRSSSLPEIKVQRQLH